MGPSRAWYSRLASLTRRPLRLFGRTLRLALYPILATLYDLLVGWYLWVAAIVMVVALVLLGAMTVQRRRRSGGVLSVRPRPKRDRQ